MIRPAVRAAQWFCAWLGCLFVLTAAAETPFKIDAWSTSDGLPQSSVISVIQTRDGYLWLGTLNGLVRFDGNRFTVFDENNTPGLASGRIVFLFEDSRTNLWIGTDAGGVALVQAGVVNNLSSGGGHEHRLLQAYEDEKGAVWFYFADGHVSFYQNGRLQDNPGMVSVELVLRAMHRVVPSRTGGFWYLQNGRVQKWRDNKMQRDVCASPWREATPLAAAGEDAGGNLVVGTLGEGLFLVNENGHFQHIGKAEGLSSDYVLSLCFDTEKNLWVGTDGDGLNRLKQKSFSLPALRPLAAQSVAVSTNGEIWTAFNAAGMSRWTTNGAQNFGIGRSSNAWTVFVDRQQNIWAGTRGEGLFVFQTDHFEPVPGAVGAEIFAIYQTRHGELCIGSERGLAIRMAGKWKVLTSREGLAAGAVRAIAEDAQGDLWVGTESGGLNHLSGTKITSFAAAPFGLPGNDISALCVDREGVLWVGTAGHGMARLKDGKWTRFAARDGLVSNAIGYIVEDESGDLWIGSNAGLLRCKKNALEAFASGAVDQISGRIYREADGLPTRECASGSQPAACCAADGRLFFSTTKGLVSVNPTELKTNRRPPQVRIEQVRVEGREQNTNLLNAAAMRKVVLPPSYEQLEIDYTALNFSAPQDVRFRYRLEGRESKWTEVGAARVAQLAKIPPGEYVFHVTAENEDGVSATVDAVLALTVLPEFWQTRWFLAAVILMLLTLTVAVVRYFSTQKLRRQLQLHRQQEQLEQERARIARDLHDQLGANLTQVALLGELAEADKELPVEVESHAQQIQQTARETTRSLDEIVWAVNPANDTLEGLVNYACKYAQEYFALAEIRCRSDVPTESPVMSIPPDVRHNGFLAFKEAVNNVVKHAQATEAWIRLRLTPENFVLEIEDNGRGVPATAAVSDRNGLRNMRRRMEDIGGKFSIGPGASGGTKVLLAIPLRKSAR